MPDNVFRHAVEAPVASETAPGEALAVEIPDAGNRDIALTGDEINQSSPLEEWEIKNGKYGAEYLGIKEVVKEFPYNADFSVVDKYIKGELEERGYDKTPKAWQDILAEIENDIQSSKLSAIDRLKKLSSYVKVLQKLKAAKKMKDNFK